MSYLLSIIYMLAFMASAGIVSGHIFKTERVLARLVLALALALTGLMWFPALFAFVLGFTRAALFAALGLAVAIGAVFAALGLKRRTSPNAPVRRLIDEKTAAIIILPLFALTVYLLHTHILKTSMYGALESGQSTYGDMPMHLGFITSISNQKTFPPNYNLIAGGVPLGYPFLCDSISSVFFTLTGDHRFSYLLPMYPAVLAVFGSVFLFFDTWLGRKSRLHGRRFDSPTAALASVLFFVGGGFGFAYFLDLLRRDGGNLTRIFTGFYTTPTNYVDKNILWVNPIADMLIPQRSTLFGWALLIPCLFLLYRAAFEGERRYFIPLSVLAGALPMIHTHSFLALVMLSAVYLVRALVSAKAAEAPRECLKPWLAYAVIAGALALPQLLRFTFRQASGDNFLRIGLNWVNGSDNYLWFYIKNIGLTYLLAIPAFLHADRDSKWLYAGGLLLLLTAELVIFQPNPYDNNKLIFIWYLLNCGLAANFLSDIYVRLSDMGGVRILAALTLIVMNLSGVLTLGREAVSRYEVFGRAQVEAAAFISDNLPPDSLFLTANNHNNAVAALTGRNIMVGSGSYLYYHGVKYIDMEIAQREMFGEPDMDDFIRYGIDYVYISDHERFNYSIDFQFFEKNFNKVYESGGVLIYEVGR